MTKWSLVIISDCMSHDSIAVYVFLQEVTSFVSSISCDIDKFIFFSDGAPQQFKNLKHFSNIYNFEKDFGKKVQWHFFASAHGKGPCNGVRGTFKRQATRASLQMDAEQITTPLELYNGGSKSATLPSITFKLKTNEDYQKANLFLQPRFEKCKPIPGTQKLHCIIPKDNNTVTVKKYSYSKENEVISIVKSVSAKKKRASRKSKRIAS